MSNAILKRLQREYNDLIESGEYEISLETDKLIDPWIAVINGPKSSPYEGGKFKLKIQYSNDYPFNPPEVTFLTKIYHPNISKNGTICIDILKDNWTPNLRIYSVLTSIISLLTDANPASPLETEIAELYVDDNKTYIKNAIEMTKKYAMNK